MSPYSVLMVLSASHTGTHLTLTGSLKDDPGVGINTIIIPGDSQHVPNCTSEDATSEI